MLYAFNSDYIASGRRKERGGVLAGVRGCWMASEEASSVLLHPLSGSGKGYGFLASPYAPGGALGSLRMTEERRLGSLSFRASPRAV